MKNVYGNSPEEDYQIAEQDQEQEEEDASVVEFAALSNPDKEALMARMLESGAQFVRSPDGGYEAVVDVGTLQRQQTTTKKPRIRSDSGIESGSQKRLEQLGKRKEEAKKRREELLRAAAKIKKSQTPKREVAGGSTAKKMLSMSKREPQPVRRVPTARQTKTRTPELLARPAQKRSPHPKESEEAISAAVASGTEYDLINKPYLVPCFDKHILNPGEFARFIELVAIPPNVRAKRLPLGELLKLVEEIFSARFSAETAMLKSRMGDQEEVIGTAANFPQSTAGFLAEKYKHKTAVYQKAADIVRSVEMEREECVVVELFAKFLAEVYDTRDLIFFLYARSQVEKELDLKLTALQGEKKKLVYTVGGQLVGASKLISACDADTRNVYISERAASRIHGIFFEDSRTSQRPLWRKIEDSMQSVKGLKEKHISAIAFLHLLLTEFHANRVDETDEDKGASSDSSFRRSPPRPASPVVSAPVPEGGNPVGQVDKYRAQLQQFQEREETVAKGPDEQQIAQ